MKKHTTIPLDNQPEFSQALGRMLGHWAFLESMLSYILGRLLGIEQSRLHMLYHSFNSVTDKIKLTQRLIHIYVIACNEKTDLLNLVDAAFKLNTIRNSYVHAIWGQGSDKNTLTQFDMRVPTNTKKRIKEYKTVSVDTINSFVQDISELSLKLDQFLHGDMKKIQILRLPLE